MSTCGRVDSKKRKRDRSHDKGRPIQTVEGREDILSGRIVSAVLSLLAVVLLTLG